MNTRDKWTKEPRNMRTNEKLPIEAEKFHYEYKIEVFLLVYFFLLIIGNLTSLYFICHTSICLKWITKNLGLTNHGTSKQTNQKQTEMLRVEMGARDAYSDQKSLVFLAE